MTDEEQQAIEAQQAAALFAAGIERAKLKITDADNALEMARILLGEVKEEEIGDVYEKLVDAESHVSDAVRVLTPFLGPED